MFPFPTFIPLKVVTPGSQTFNSSGTFTVPAYNTMTVTVKGAGGGGASNQYTDSVDIVHASNPGSAGGLSRFVFGTNPTGNGGGGGGITDANADGTTGSSGTATGGTTNTTGGGSPGGSGGGFSPDKGGNGGPGGKAIISYTSDTGPTTGANITITVGAGGAGGPISGGTAPFTPSASPGSPGTDGQVVITWS